MVQTISKEAFAHIETLRNISLPSSVDWFCPFCGRRVNFRMSWSYTNNIPSVLFCSSSCSGCRKESTFIYVGFLEDTKSPKEGKLFIYPIPKTRIPLEGVFGSSKFTPGLCDAYKSAVNVYNTREWNGTTVLCRRLLEGITKQMLPEEKRNLSLSRQLEELPKHVDLQKPLLTLADTLRKGGNIGAHFDVEKTPDEEISTLMMDLLDYLIEYIYILPNKIEELHKKIEGLSKE